MNKGLFITFEGVDGCGKSTIAKMIVDKLIELNYPILFTREPGGNLIAEKIREIILDPNNTMMDNRCETLLYAASRRQHMVEQIIPALKENKIVICDRFIDSSLAYQGYARNIGIDQVRTINEFAIESFYPYKTIFFDISVDKTIERIKQRENKDRLDLENITFHNNVQEGYKIINKHYKNRILYVDASKNIEQVYKQTLDIIIKVINDSEYTKG